MRIKRKLTDPFRAYAVVAITIPIMIPALLMISGAFLFPEHPTILDATIPYWVTAAPIVAMVALVWCECRGSIEHYAVRIGDLEYLKSWYEATGSLKCTTICGNTLLHTAVSNSQKAIVQFLIEHGDNPHQRNVWRKSPLAIAESKNDVAMVQLLTGSLRKTE